MTLFGCIMDETLVGSYQLSIDSIPDRVSLGKILGF